MGEYGNLETSYVLGDSDPFDKFVIQVSSDKRFGTPLFKTIGGASRCPENRIRCGERLMSRLTKHHGRPVRIITSFHPILPLCLMS